MTPGLRRALAGLMAPRLLAEPRVISTGAPVRIVGGVAVYVAETLTGRPYYVSSVCRPATATGIQDRLRAQLGDPEAAGWASITVFSLDGDTPCGEVRYYEGVASTWLLPAASASRPVRRQHAGRKG